MKGLTIIKPGKVQPELPTIVWRGKCNKCGCEVEGDDSVGPPSINRCEVTGGHWKVIFCPTANCYSAQSNGLRSRINLRPYFADGQESDG